MSAAIWQHARNACLGYQIYDLADRVVLRIKLRLPLPAGMFFVTGLLYVLFYLLPAAVANWPPPMPILAFAVALLGGAGAVLVRYAYNILLPMATSSATELTATEEGRAKAFNWIIDSFSMRPQLVFGVITDLLALLTLGAVDVFVSGFQLAFPSYVLMAAVGFIGGAATYWIRIPRYLGLLNTVKLNVFPLDPRSTPGIQRIRSAIVGTLVPIGFAMAMLLSLWVAIVPHLNQPVMVGLMASWYLMIPVLFSVYYFGTMGLLGRLVARGKRQVLGDLQSELQMYYDRRGSLSEQERQNFLALSEIYAQVQKAPESLNDKKGVSRYLLAMVVQGIPFMLTFPWDKAEQFLRTLRI